MAWMNEIVRRMDYSKVRFRGSGRGLTGFYQQAELFVDVGDGGELAGIQDA
jgi:hypothetical protein